MYELFIIIVSSAISSWVTYEIMSKRNPLVSAKNFFARYYKSI